MSDLYRTAVPIEVMRAATLLPDPGRHLKPSVGVEVVGPGDAGPIHVAFRRVTLVSDDGPAQRWECVDLQRRYFDAGGER